MIKSRAGWLTVVLAALAPLAPARPAQACGGFFCNQPTDPTQLPVAQTAENVLFAMDRDTDGQFKLEAHVQIFYTGPADKFSWVVPVDSQPTLDVGSNVIFSTLLRATQPSFSLAWETSGMCKVSNSGAGGSSSSASYDAAIPLPSGAADGGAGVDLAFRGDVGPYDAAIVRSTNTQDPKPLIDWLNTNGYFVSASAAHLIADYVKEDKYFVAIRLLGNKSVGEITPLVMRFRGPGPCVPLRLTSIAALKDLKVNLWVLADHRVVPSNYFEIELDQAALNWFRAGDNYDELIKQAANEVGGNAFTTDYAGPTSMLKGAFYQPERYNVAQLRLQATTPPDALDAIAAQNFPRDAALLKVLRTHIPVPQELSAMGVDERSFYNQLRFYWETKKALFKPFVGKAFVDEVQATLIEPLHKIQDLVDGHAKLTRLTTFISPEEMTSDPIFVQNPSLVDVPLMRTARAIRHCGAMKYDPCTAPVQVVTTDGQEIWFMPKPQGYCYDRAYEYERETVQDLPALARGWVRSADGAGELKFDRKAEIAAALKAHNAAVAAAHPGTGVGSAAGGAPGTSGAGGRAGTGGAGKPGGTGGAGAVSDADSSSGCGCRVGGQTQTPALVSLLALAGLGLVRRRRSR
jgi:MYXO-CTERM domain-containing protein